MISQTSSAASYIVQLTTKTRHSILEKTKNDIVQVEADLWDYYVLVHWNFLICLTMKIKAESVFTETEGGSVDISCKYPDGYQYTPMYFCRDPCSYSDVLIKSVKADTFVSEGRYTARNTLSTRSFSVTIRHLTLKDSGVYYCGVDAWGKDKLTKVKLTVSEVLRPNQNPEATEQHDASTMIKATAAPTVSTRDPVSRQNQSPHNDTKYCM
ncbi:hypothetical protein AMELA_G00262770 [Ameiurus melas]|uniref:Immunoglobulin domain-containing protein n=1 Tax=Ameiurus melas TaxID=219545 RepID=A0A7J5ZR97_AMEME|nr:hypothetical protein AMELA_G00262770 [Ameiurus melas]